MADLRTLGNGSYSAEADFLVKALDKCKKAYKENPLFFPFETIINQLEYLINFEKGKNIPSLLTTKINIGKDSHERAGWL